MGLSIYLLLKRNKPRKMRQEKARNGKISLKSQSAARFGLASDRHLVRYLVNGWVLGANQKLVAREVLKHPARPFLNGWVLGACHALMSFGNFVRAAALSETTAHCRNNQQHHDSRRFGNGSFRDGEPTTAAGLPEVLLPHAIIAGVDCVINIAIGGKIGGRTERVAPHDVFPTSIRPRNRGDPRPLRAIGDAAASCRRPDACVERRDRAEKASDSGGGPRTAGAASLKAPCGAWLRP